MEKAKQGILDRMGLDKVRIAYWNLPFSALIEKAIIAKQGSLTTSGAIACDTGKFTGRSPKDKFVVADEKTEGTIWWGEVNNKISQGAFDKIQKKMRKYLSGQEIFIKEVYACASSSYKLNLRIVTEHAWQSLFVHNMFLRLEGPDLQQFKEDWTILCAPGFFANPKADGTRSENFTIINFTSKVILIGGSAYTGEIKGRIYSTQLSVATRTTSVAYALQR